MSGPFFWILIVVFILIVAVCLIPYLLRNSAFLYSFRWVFFILVLLCLGMAIYLQWKQPYVIEPDSISPEYHLHDNGWIRVCLLTAAYLLTFLFFVFVKGIHKNKKRAFLFFWLPGLVLAVLLVYSGIRSEQNLPSQERNRIYDKLRGHG